MRRWHGEYRETRQAVERRPDCLGDTGAAIWLGANDTVVGACVTGGGSIARGLGARASIDSGEANPLLTTLSNAQSEAASYATYLAGLTTTTNLGNVALKKYQSPTMKLDAGINVVAIDNITTGARTPSRCRRRSGDQRRDADGRRYQCG